MVSELKRAALPVGIGLMGVAAYILLQITAAACPEARGPATYQRKGRASNQDSHSTHHSGLR